MKNELLFFCSLSLFFLPSCQKSEKTVDFSSTNNAGNLVDTAPYLYWERERDADSTQIANLQLETPLGANYSLQTLIDQQALVFYFDEYACGTCVDNYLDVLNELSDSINPEKIIILSNYKEKRLLRIKKNKFKLIQECYIPSGYFDIPMNDTIEPAPFMFLLDQNLQVSLPRIGAYPDSINNPYFQNIISILQDQ